ncbi:helix-turn-helix domain-containing protein [Kitasatospora purpeofusca]|uniref:helix-turn-helix domain-containing protein n=1 Tax=Kitasatospora purpeofusca TaxID=67352 RepID=UPI0036D3242C
MSAHPRDLTPGRSARDFFGAEIRHYRTEAGLSLTELAGVVQYSKSHLANIETAVRTPPPDLPDLLDDALPTGDFFKRMYPLVHSERFPNWSQRFMVLEAVATYMRKYSAGTIPGLWQTAEYARAAFQLGRPRADEAEIERVWSARKARQVILARENPPHMWVVLDEAVIRRSIGGAGVMHRQIEHVLNMVDGPNSEVQVIPFSVGGHGLMGTSLTLLDFLDAPRVAYSEAYWTGQLLESSKEVQAAALIYDHLQAAALPPTESKAWLHRVLEDYRE